MSHKVQLINSEYSFNCNLEAASLLDAALAAQIVLTHSCKNGQCGECKIKIICGEVVWSDNYNILSAEEIADRNVLSCCAVPVSDLVIEAEHLPELAGVKCQTLPARVAACNLVSENIVHVKLRLPPGKTLQYLAGQYLDLSYQGLVRSYSIANANMHDCVLDLHIRLLADGAMSAKLFPHLPANELLRISGPKGTFFLRDNNRPVLLLATGTGYAPIRAMLQHLATINSVREVYFFWGNSQSQSFYDLPWLYALNEYLPNFSFVPVLRRPDGVWKGAVGAVFDPAVSAIADLKSYDIYACGAPSMIASAKATVIKHGAISSRFYADAFFANN